MEEMEMKSERQIVRHLALGDWY